MADELYESSNANHQTGGHPYFDLKSTLELFILEKRWSSLELASRNMITLYPDTEFGWFALGIALSKLEDHDGAVQNLKKAIYLNPDFTSSYYQMGIAYYNLRDFSNSIRYYHEAIKRGMRTHSIYYNIGNAWYSIGDIKNAVEFYHQSLSIRPDFTLAAYGLFRIYYEKEDYKNAVSTLDPFIKDNELPSFLLSKAKILYEDESHTSYQKLRQAHKILNSAIDLNDGFGAAYYERAYVKSCLGDNKGFAADRAMAFLLNPELRKGHSVNLYSTSYS